MDRGADQHLAGRLVLITGAQAAGKTTVAAALARRLPRAVHVDGDIVQGFVVSGAVPMELPPSAAMLEQLRCRYAGMFAVARVYRHAGFDAVVSDNVFGVELPRLLGGLFTAEPDLTVHLVMLDPDSAEIERRERERPKTGYSEDLTIPMLVDAVRRRTVRIGLWRNTTGEDVEQVVEAILADWPGSAVRREHLPHA